MRDTDINILLHNHGRRVNVFIYFAIHRTIRFLWTCIGEKVSLTTSTGSEQRWSDKWNRDETICAFINELPLRREDYMKTTMLGF